MNTAQYPATVNVQGSITVYLTSCFKGWRKERTPSRKEDLTLGLYYMHKLWFCTVYYIRITFQVHMHKHRAERMIIHMHAMIPNECKVTYNHCTCAHTHTHSVHTHPSLSLPLALSPLSISPPPPTHSLLSPSPSSRSLRLSTSMGNTSLDISLTNRLLAASSSALFFKLSELSLDNSSESSASFLRKFFCRTLLILCSRWWLLLSSVFNRSHSELKNVEDNKYL